MKSPLGFVGIGIMGKGMIKNLVTKLGDTNLVVWNRGRDVSEEIMALYPGRVSIALTAADVIKQCDVTFSMLSTMEASKAVFDDEKDGVINAVSPGKIIVDCATLSPERMVDENERISAKGGRFIEAPVSGSKVPAETGTLIFLCGGDPDVYSHETVSMALDAMGKAKFLFGPVGQGSRVKLVVNMIMGTMMGAFVEGAKLAEASDIPLDKLFEVLDLGAMANPMFKGKGPNVINKSFAPHFPLKHAQKDMRLALEMAASLDVELPTTTAANSLYLRVLEERGDEDFSAVATAVEQRGCKN